MPRITIKATYTVNNEPYEDNFELDFDPENSSEHLLEYLDSSEGGPVLRPANPPQ